MYLMIWQKIIFSLCFSFLKIWPWRVPLGFVWTCFHLLSPLSVGFHVFAVKEPSWTVCSEHWQFFSFDTLKCFFQLEMQVFHQFLQLSVTLSLRVLLALLFLVGTGLSHAVGRVSSSHCVLLIFISLWSMSSDQPYSLLILHELYLVCCLFHVDFHLNACVFHVLMFYLIFSDQSALLTLYLIFPFMASRGLKNS